MGGTGRSLLECGTGGFVFQSVTGHILGLHAQRADEAGTGRLLLEGGIASAALKAGIDGALLEAGRGRTLEAGIG